MIAITLVCVAAGYLAVVGGLYVFQRNILFLPSSHVGTPGAAGAGDMREVTLETADGLALARGTSRPATASGRWSTSTATAGTSRGG